MTTAANALWSCRYLTQLADLTYHAIYPLLPKSIYSTVPVNKTNKKGSISHLGRPFNKTGILIILSFCYTLSPKRRARRQVFRFWNVCMILNISPSAGFVLLAEHRERLTRVYLSGNEILSNITVSFWRKACDAYKPRALTWSFKHEAQGQHQFKRQGELCWNDLIRSIPGKTESKSPHKLQDT